MLPIYQDAKDDCLMACVASIIECSLQDLPVLGDQHRDGSWYEVVQSSLREKGFELVYTDNYPAFLPYGYHIGAGPSPRGCTGGHAVVCLDGRIVHDPHESNAGIAFVEYWCLIYPLDSKNRTNVHG